MLASLLAQIPAKFLPNVAAALVFALIVGSAIVLAARSRRPVLLLSLGLVVLVVSILSNTNWRLFGGHTVMHMSIVYEIFERGAPPEMSLVAGEALQYFYMFHALVANAMQVLPVAPNLFFSALNLFCLIATIWVIDRLAQLVSAEPMYRAVTIAVVIFGLTTFISGPPGLIIEELLGLPGESRLDWFHKYGKTNNNQLGILLFAVGFLACAGLVLEKSRTASLTLLGAAWLGVGFLYPPNLFGFAAMATAAAAQLWFLEKPARRQDALIILGILTIGGILMLPWLLSLTSSRTGDGEFQLISIARIPGNAYILAGLLATPVLIYWIATRLTDAKLSMPGPLLRFLLTSTLGISVAFLLSVGSHSASLEHKILNLTHLPLGILASVFLVEIVRSRTLVAVACMVLLVFPVGFKFGPVLFYGLPAVDVAKTSGRYYRHTDPDQDALYQWLVNNTPTEAVVVDGYLSMPVFARRSLFLGVDHRRESGELDGKFDGWGQRASRMIGTVNGIDQTIVQRRKTIVDQLLLTDQEALSPEVFEKLRSEVPDRPIYIVARSEPVLRRLTHAGSDRLDAVFSNPAATILSVN